jgi:hypothetical protein
MHLRGQRSALYLFVQNRAWDGTRSGGPLFAILWRIGMVAESLSFGPLGETCVHLCVDMQRLFVAGSPWGMPWMARVVPRICALA